MISAPSLQNYFMRRYEHLERHLARIIIEGKLIQNIDDVSKNKTTAKKEIYWLEAWNDNVLK